MVLRHLSIGLFIVTSLYLLLSYHVGVALAASEISHNTESRRQRSRNEGKIIRPPLYARSARLKNEPFISDFIVDDDDLFDMSKRQQPSSDDYGHLRFGKRGDEKIFDDYGHMRFGRNGPEIE